MAHIANDIQQNHFTSVHSQAALFTPSLTSASLDELFEKLRAMPIATVSGFGRVPNILGMEAMVMSHRDGNTVLVKSCRGWIMIGPHDKLTALMFDDIRDGDHMVVQQAAA